MDLEELEIERPEELCYTSDLDPELEELEYAELDLQALEDLPLEPEW